MLGDLRRSLALVLVAWASGSRATDKSTEHDHSATER